MATLPTKAAQRRRHMWVVFVGLGIIVALQVLVVSQVAYSHAELNHEVRQRETEIQSLKLQIDFLRTELEKREAETKP